MSPAEAPLPWPTARLSDGPLLGILETLRCHRAEDLETWLYSRVFYGPASDGWRL